MSSALRKFIPFADKILIKKLKVESKTVGGLLLATDSKESLNEAIVLAVGPGKYIPSKPLVVPNVKVGDKIFVSTYGGSSIKIENEEMKVITEADILGKFE